MMTSRDFTSIINFILDNICPPILRDCYPLMFPIYYLAYGKQTARLLKYKDRYPFLSEAEYAEYYACAATTRLSARPTDLNEAGLRFVLSHIPAGSVCLDAGSGRRFLAKKISSAGNTVYGLDIEKPKDFSEADGYTFVSGSVENIPFPDNAFDVVVCTHVLEHVRDLNKAMQELLRVAEKRLLIVLPRQREYRFVADLHIRYFPYVYNVQKALSVPNAVITRVGSDWGVIVENPSVCPYQPHHDL